MIAIRLIATPTANVSTSLIPCPMFPPPAGGLVLDALDRSQPS